MRIFGMLTCMYMHFKFYVYLLMNYVMYMGILCVCIEPDYKDFLYHRIWCAIS